VSITVPEADYLISQDANQGDVVRSVADYLGKPRLVQEVQWTPSQGANTQLVAFDSYLGTNDQFFLNKVTGFHGISYDTHVKCVINATPFMSGCVKLGYLPNGFALGPRATDQRLNRILNSQIPSVYATTLDRGVEMHIPYCSIFNYRVDRFTDPARIYLDVFSPLRVGDAVEANAAVTISIWIWYSNVKLFGASILPPVERQSGRVIRKMKSSHSPSEAEIRPMSTVLGGISTVARGLASIPTIAPAAGMVANIAEYMSSSARSLGFSRPIDNALVTPVGHHYHRYHANSAAASNASVLALSPDAKTRITTGLSPNAEDEMSLASLKKRWAFFDSFNINQDAAVGQLLYQRDLNPRLSFRSLTGAVSSMTPIGFLAELHRYYRGSVEIMFKIVKTGFHSGSIAISYTNNTSDPTPTFNQTSILNRTIVNLDEGEEVCLNFPYIDTQAVRSCNEAYGRFYVHMVNRLVFPETVDSTISVLMFVRGGDDLEFSTLHSNLSARPLGNTPVEPQSGTGIGQSGEVVCSTVGGLLADKQVTGIQVMDSLCEATKSLLQICKIGAPVLTSDVDAAGTLLTESTFYLNPGVMGTYFGSGPDFSLFNPVLSPIRSLYAFTRGSYEVNLFNAPAENSQAGFTASVYRVPNQAYGRIAGGSATNFSDIDQYWHQNSIARTAGGEAPVPATRLPSSRATNRRNYGLSVIVPQKLLHKAALNVGVSTPAYSSLLDRVTQQDGLVVSANLRTICHVRAADDFYCHFFIGVPQMFLTLHSPTFV